MQEHVNDPFVQRAKAEGYRSRAAFKLLEIDKKDRLLKPGQTLIDLGATPGGWSQVATQRYAGKGCIVAVDLLEMVGLPAVDFILGDFQDEKVRAQIDAILKGRKADLVLSDMAPNISGVASADQARVIGLAEEAMAFACEYLKPDGAFLVKVFQGAGFEQLLRDMRARFEKVVSRKPEASRDRSSEMYLLAKTLKSGVQEESKTA